MRLMTVRELIEALEEMPQDLPVVADSKEIDIIVIRNEIYYSSDAGYIDGEIIKLY